MRILLRKQRRTGERFEEILVFSLIIPRPVLVPIKWRVSLDFPITFLFDQIGIEVLSLLIPGQSCYFLINSQARLTLLLQVFQIIQLNSDCILQMISILYLLVFFLYNVLIGVFGHIILFQGIHTWSNICISLTINW